VGVEGGETHAVGIALRFQFDCGLLAITGGGGMTAGLPVIELAAEIEGALQGDIA